MADDDKKPAPATDLQSPADRGARATDEKAPAARAGETVTPFSPEQLVTPAPSMIGSRQMWIMAGPYRGTVLTMPDAEAESAKDNHWAVEMSTVAPPFDADNPAEHDHELTDEDRAHAVEAANEWAANVNKPPEPEPPPPEGGAARRQALAPDKPASGYTTRSESDPTKKR